MSDEQRVEDVFDALELAEAAWGGGTRIGHAFQRVRESDPAAVDRRTVVIVISNGIERGDLHTLTESAAWLGRRSTLFLWLNPLAAQPNFEPTARGMAAAMPTVDGLYGFAGLRDVDELARQLAEYDRTRLGCEYLSPSDRQPAVLVATDQLTDMEIGIIGAGAASAAATYVLDEAVPDARITVLEKSGGVCGRAATRRNDGRHYDYGANYLKDDDQRVVDLVTETLDTTGLVSIEEPVYVFDKTGTVSEGRDEYEQKWTYDEGLTQIAKRLFSRTDATIQLRTRVETIRREGDRWKLHDTDGQSWGPFDILLCNPPAPQTAELLADAEWDAEIREKLAEAVEAVPYRSVWTAVLGYDFELDLPYYAVVNTDKEHDVGWISREECKPGHVPDGESLLIVQANHEWSVEHYDDPPGENIAELADQTATVIGDNRLTSPAWTDHQGWRYALPEAAVARGPLDSAEDHGLYCLGDWVPGEGRLHAALRNGLDTGERIVHSL